MLSRIEKKWWVGMLKNLFFDEIVGGVIYLLLQRATFPLGSSAHLYCDGGICRETLEWSAMSQVRWWNVKKWEARMVRMSWPTLHSAGSLERTGMADGGPVVGDSLYRLDEASMGGYGRVKACLVSDVSLLNAWTGIDTYQIAAFYVNILWFYA